MPNGEDFLWRPCLSEPPLCTLKELLDGTYDLADVAAMNEALDVRSENIRRATVAAERKAQR